MKYSDNKAFSILIAMSVASGLSLAQGLAIEEVIVTAQKRTESLQDVPVSVSSLNTGDLEGLKLRNAADIAAQVPNLQIQTPYGDTQPYFSLRGVSMLDYSHHQSSPVAMYVDETYKSVGAIQALQIYDLDRIEVLRGPQGTLYGKNATGGAVNFITQVPNFEQEGYLILGLGNYNKREAKGAYQLPLVDEKLAARAAFTMNKVDGWVENELPGGNDQAEADEWAFRLSVLYQPTENLNALLRLFKSEADAENYGVFADNVDPNAVVDPVTFEPITRNGLDFFENQADRRSKKELDNSGLSLTVNWDFNDRHTLTSITAYDKGEWVTIADDDGLPINLDHNDNESDVRQVTQELRITSDYSGPFNWIAGLYWGQEEIELSNHFRFFDDYFISVADFGFDLYGINEYSEFTQTRTSTAAFLHSTYQLSDALTLTFGLRYTEDKTDFEDFYALVGGLDDSPSNGGVELLTQTIPVIDSTFVGFTPGTNLKGGGFFPDESFKDNNVSGKIGLDWQVTNDVMIYGSFSQGYRTGAINGLAFFDVSELTSVDPEEVDAWEVGVKSQLFDNRLQVNGAAFFYDYTNQQFINATAGGLQILENADESEIMGFELEAIALLSNKLTVRSGLGYLDTKYKDLTLSGVDLSGNELISSPKWNFNAMVTWELMSADMGTFTLLFDTSFTDDQFFDAANTERTMQDSYWLHNTRLTFDSSDEKYSVAAWVKNIADKEYFVYGLPLLEFGLGFDFMQRGMPRTYGVEFTMRF